MESDGPDDPIIPMKKSLSLVLSGKGLCNWLPNTRYFVYIRSLSSVCCSVVQMMSQEWSVVWLV